jgi:DNA-binding MarR family transcriptional regulator
MKVSAAEQMLRAFKDFRAIVWRVPMRESIKFLHRHNMSLAGIVSLMTLGERGELSVSDLAEETGLSLAAESQLVNKLVRDGFVRRTEHPGDRRRKQVTLTARGTAFLRRMDGAHTGAALAVLRQLPESTLRQITAGLQKGLEQLPAADL